jgi:membrane-bound ClpP family serine protease
MAALIIGMIILGIILVVLEILVLPGLVSGIIGVLMIVVGVSMSYTEFGQQGGLITLGFSIIGTLLAIYLSFKRRSWKRFGLKDTIDSHVNDVEVTGVEPGAVGIALSALRPSGTVQIDNNKMEANSLGEWIDTDSKIEVIEVLPNKVIVKQISK